MRYALYSYRFARQILDDAAYAPLRDEILEVVSQTPLPVFAGKSARNSHLDVVQQIINTYYDYEFGVEHGWEYHPSATAIEESALQADFKKEIPPRPGQERLAVQIEAQFGNMARWYADVFKFQTSYSQGKVDLGVCILPTSALAGRMDSNLAHYERVCRELPYAKMSITLPILVIGIEPDEETVSYELRQSPLAGRPVPSAGAFTGKGTADNRYRVVHAIRQGIPLAQVDETFPTGLMATRQGPTMTETGDEGEDG